MPCESTVDKVLFEWSHHKISSKDSKVRTICVSITDSGSERANSSLITLISLSREGVATVIHESAEQLSEKPSVVVVSVGGGGLMSGVLKGMHDVGWVDVPLVAMETKGADSFDAAVQAGELVTLDAITRLVF